MTTISFFDLELWEKEYFHKRMTNYTLNFSEKSLTEKNAAKYKNTDVLCVFIYSKITKKILDLLPKLKLICTLSTGYDHIDLNECKKRNITVCNVPSYGENTVAEHAFALILTISRKIVPSTERTRRGNFDLTDLRGFDLKEKTLGVIGTGKIGTHVIKMAHGFDMKIIAYDPFPNVELSHVLGFEYVSLEELLSKSDIITLHAPLTEKTKHLLNEKNINKIKKGAVLINTARGGLVQTHALVEALKKGILSAVGLDVLEEECFIREEKELVTNVFKTTCDIPTALEEHILLGMDNVIITPHNAFNSQEALLRILETTQQNVNSFFKKKLINVVKV